MFMYHEVLETRTAYATASLTTTIIPPPGATGGVFMLRISAVAGTTPILDCKLQLAHPGSGQAIDVDNGAFAQQTAASFQAMFFYPTVGTADTTGNYRSCQGMVASKMFAAWTLDRTTGDETYTFTLEVDWHK